MFDSGILFILIFLGIVLTGRMKLIAQVQKRETAGGVNKPQPPKPLPRQVRPEPAKTPGQVLPSFEGRQGSVMSSNLVKTSAQKEFRPLRSPMVSGLKDSSEGFAREWAQDARDDRKQSQAEKAPDRPTMPVFARANLLQSFIAHEILDKPKFRQRGRIV